MFEGKLDKEGHNASKVFLAHKRIQDQENLQGRQASKGVPDSNQDLAKSRFEEGIWGEQGGGTGGQRAVNRGFRVGSNQPSERVALHPTIFTVQYWHCTWCSTENTLLHLVVDLCSRPRQWFFAFPHSRVSPLSALLLQPKPPPLQYHSHTHPHPQCCLRSFHHIHAHIHPLAHHHWLPHFDPPPHHPCGHPHKPHQHHLYCGVSRSAVAGL